MPKVVAPLLSMDARGQIGKAQVFSSWKGIPYARRYTIPANPRTTKQVTNRNIWQMLGVAWQYAPAPVQAAFNAFAKGKPLTGRNKFFSVNQQIYAVQPPVDSMAGFIVSPGANGGLPPSGLVVTPALASLEVDCVIPAAPDGWTIVASHATAIIEQAPDNAFAGVFAFDSETAAPGANVITGLQTGTEYIVGVFLEWTKPDGSTAYSVSLASTGTPT